MTAVPLQSVGPRRPLPRRAVVLGASGMVGRSWCGLLTAHAVPHRALSRPEINLLQPDSLAGAVHQDDQLVINAAAWTDVDGAESQESDATVANARAPGALAGRCADVGATLIHYSTDYVFDGRASAPYPIDAPIAPINAYGRSKAAGEMAVRESGADHLILRTSWVYAPWGKNFVRTISSLASQRETLDVVDDQKGRPTSAESLAKQSIALYLAGARGTWHSADAGECTWFDLACETVKRLRLTCNVQPCDSELFPRPALRPGYSTLDIQATERLIGGVPKWRESLYDVLRRIETSEVRHGPSARELKTGGPKPSR